MSIRQANKSRTRIGKAGVTALVATGILIAWVSLLIYEDRYQARLSPLQEQHETMVTDAIQKLGQKIGHLSELTFLLRHDEAVVRALPENTPLRTAKLHERFVVFSKSSDLISQVRWLDHNGVEKARVNIDQGQVSIVAKDELQDKSDRYYIQQARYLGPNQVFYSRIDLNVEQGRIQQPRTPTLRTVIKTGDQGKMRAGFLVVNFSLDQLFNSIRQMHNTSVQISLVNRQGYWLLHTDPAREWGFMTGRDELSLPKQAPELWQKMQRQPALYGLQHQEALWSYTRFSPENKDTRGPDALGEIFALVETPATTLQAIKSRVLIPVALVATVLYLLLASGLYLHLRSNRERNNLLTQLRQEERTLKDTNRELKTALDTQQTLQDELVETRKLSSLGLMVAGVAHELNTPNGGTQMALTTLESRLQKLEAQVKSGSLTLENMYDFLEKEREGLDIAKRNTRRTAELIQSFKRLAIDRQQSTATWFSLKNCMNDLDQALIPRLKKAAQSVSFSVPDIKLFGHPGILSQVIQNLIENALNHAYGHDQKGIIKVMAREQSGQLKLSVQDDGAGLTPGTSQRLFDPFFTTGRHQGNTGLGLHLVHQWVTQTLKGTITFHSNPGQGTRFDILIPCVITQPSPETASEQR